MRKKETVIPIRRPGDPMGRSWREPLQNFFGEKFLPGPYCEVQTSPQYGPGRKFLLGLVQEVSIVPTTDYVLTTRIPGEDKPGCRITFYFSSILGNRILFSPHDEDQQSLSPPHIAVMNSGTEDLVPLYRGLM